MMSKQIQAIKAKIQQTVMEIQKAVFELNSDDFHIIYSFYGHTSAIYIGVFKFGHTYKATTTVVADNTYIRPFDFQTEDLNAWEKCLLNLQSSLKELENLKKEHEQNIKESS